MSKGMQQRLGIAQALIGAPRLLLLDEPTSALDPAGRRTVRDLLEELRRRGVAVLLNTHLLSEVEHVCDRVAIIDRGELRGRRRPRPSWRGRAASRSRPRPASATSRARRATTCPASSPSSWPRASRSTACASCARRSRTPTSRSIAGARHEREPARSIVARHALREALRRRVFAVVLVLTAAFGVLYAWGASELFSDVNNLGGGQFGPRRAHARGRDDARAGDVRRAVPRRRAGRVPDPRRGARRRRARAAAAARRAPARPQRLPRRALPGRGGGGAWPTSCSSTPPPSWSPA